MGRRLVKTRWHKLKENCLEQISQTEMSHVIDLLYIVLSHVLWPVPKSVPAHRLSHRIMKLKPLFSLIQNCIISHVYTGHAGRA